MSKTESIGPVPMTPMETDSQKIDRILDILSEEINVHPDTLLNGASDWIPLKVTTNITVPLTLATWVETNDTGTYMTLQIKDAFGAPVFYKRFKAVYRDQFIGLVVEKQQGNPPPRE